MGNTQGALFSQVTSNNEKGRYYLERFQLILQRAPKNKYSLETDKSITMN